MKTTKFLTILVTALGLLAYSAQLASAEPMGTAFTYQGHLYDASYAANGSYDFAFKLYDANAGGNKVGTDVNVSDVDVIDAYFTVELDFGVGVFDGDKRWLEIGIRPGDMDDPNVYTTLDPRQEVTPTPYAIYASKAGSASGGITGSGTNNRIAKFTSSNTIGNSVIYENSQGRIGIRGAPFWYSGYGPDLHVHSGTEFVDVWLGDVNSTNGAEVGRLSFVGHGPSSFPPEDIYAAVTGKIIDSGMYTKGALLFYTQSPLEFPSGGGLEERMRIMYNGNVGIGTDNPSSKLSVIGDVNASTVYKIEGDTVLATPGTNTFVGIRAGENNTGSLNTFVGYYAGNSNTAGGQNTFVGRMTGVNSTGNNNTIVGDEAGEGLYTGSNNTFLGRAAGSGSNGSGNVFIGHGAGAFESGSNKLHISNADSNTLIYGDFSTGMVGIGATSATEARLEISPAVAQRGIYINGTSNSEIEFGPSTANVYANGPFYLGPRTDHDLYFVTQDVGNIKMVIKSDGDVGIGLTSPSEKLDVGGTARLRGLGSSAGTAIVADGNGKLWKLSSSKRYKTHIEALDADTDAVLKLRPVRFQWKTTGQNDIGLIAEEVEQQLSDLVIYDNEGKPDAVKYDRIALYLLDLVKAQQDKIAVLEETVAQNQSLEQRIAALEKSIRNQQFVIAREVQQ